MGRKLTNRPKMAGQEHSTRHFRAPGQIGPLVRNKNRLIAVNNKTGLGRRVSCSQGRWLSPQTISSVSNLHVGRAADFHDPKGSAFVTLELSHRCVADWRRDIAADLRGAPYCDVSSTTEKKCPAQPHSPLIMLRLKELLKSPALRLPKIFNTVLRVYGTTVGSIGCESLALTSTEPGTLPAPYASALRTPRRLHYPARRYRQ
jgi:hypothetical protein